MKANKIVSTLVVFLVLAIGYFAIAAFIHWGKGWGAGREAKPPKDPRFEKLERDANSPVRSLEYLESLEASRREIARNQAKAQDHPLAPKPPQLSPEPAIPSNPFGVVPDDKPVLGKGNPGRTRDLAGLLGLGPPDPTPLTADELTAALREIEEIKEKLTLPSVEKPEANTAPYTETDDLFRLFGKLKELKAAGEISDLAVRAIRNDHVVIDYMPLTYGEPRIVRSVTAAPTRDSPETNHPGETTTPNR